MKFQLVILSALLVSAFALPVPDEEVSPVKVASVPDVVKTEAVAKPEEKPVEVAKVESRSTVEEPALAVDTAEPAPKPTEEKKIAVPANAPDAELPQALPEKKDKKLNEQQEVVAVRNDEVKALPVVDTPVAAIQEQKQVIDEPKPAVVNVQPTVKSSDLAAETTEQKKEASISADSAPETKIEAEPAAPIAAEPASEDKRETPARQERGTEEEVKEEVKPVVDHIQQIAPVVEQAAVVPVVKSLPEPEEAKPALEGAKPTELLPTAVTPQLDNAAAETAPIKKETAEVQPVPAGDIPLQSSEESSPKNLQSKLPQEAEPKKVDIPKEAAETPKIEEPAKAIENLPAQPLASTDAAKPAEDKKSEESKESKESGSDESKESAESKEKN